MLQDTMFFQEPEGEDDYDAFVDTVRVYFAGKGRVHEPISFLKPSAEDCAVLTKLMSSLESTFDWDALEDLLEHKTITAVSHRMKCIFCYDGLRKFTKERAASFDAYPEDLAMSYPIAHWKHVCAEVDFNSPKAIQDAILDSYVDIVGERMGYSVIRIQQGEFDWTKPGTANLLEQLVENGKNKEFKI